MPENGPSGLMSGEWKRSTSHRATPRLYSEWHSELRNPFDLRLLCRGRPRRPGTPSLGDSVKLGGAEEVALAERDAPVETIRRKRYA